MRPSARTLGVSLNRTLGGVPPHPQRKCARTLSGVPPHLERESEPHAQRKFLRLLLPVLRDVNGGLVATGIHCAGKLRPFDQHDRWRLDVRPNVC